MSKNWVLNKLVLKHLWSRTCNHCLLSWNGNWLGSLLRERMVNNLLKLLALWFLLRGNFHYFLNGYLNYSINWNLNDPVYWNLDISFNNLRLFLVIIIIFLMILDRWRLLVVLWWLRKVKGWLRILMLRLIISLTVNYYEMLQMILYCLKCFIINLI